MTRIQILQLPEDASDERAPFALIIDQHEPQRHILGFEPPESPWDRVAEQLGARAVLYFPETVDIPANSIILAEPLLVGGSSEALTEMTRRRDEYKAAILGPGAHDTLVALGWTPPSGTA